MDFYSEANMLDKAGLKRIPTNSLLKVWVKFLRENVQLLLRLDHQDKTLNQTMMQKALGNICQRNITEDQDIAMLIQIQLVKLELF